MGNIWHSDPITPEVLESHLKLLVGQQLKSIETFEHENRSFRFSGDALVQTGSAWRLLNHYRVEVTSEDHGQPFGLPAPVDASARVMSTAAGRSVTAASVVPKSGDLLIDFGNDVQLQLLQMSCGFESWRLAAGGFEVMCYGGGQIVQIREGEPPDA